ncbi:MAG: ABC transporter substrate-binding protein [Oleispira antarctica]|nr:ABC transporter substrate-binding protein [Oleispira antarctica]MBQ0792404.1 ABC transporter substrate-binding protein [Oleispira antarctica]
MPSLITLSQHIVRTMTLIAFLLISSLSLAADGPRKVVEDAASKMTQRLITDKEKVNTQSYYVEHLVDELLLPVVDHVYMARKVLAKNWKKTSDAQKKQFIDAFKHKVIRTYAGAFKAFNGEMIIFDDAKFSKTGNRALVKSEIQRIGAPVINVTYKLFNKKGQWLTYDAVIEGVSLVKSFRDQFNQSIDQHGLAQAISLLAAEYKSETPILKMAGHSWEPYISNQLPANGLAVNIVTEVFTRAGYQVEMEFMPWQRVTEEMEAGSIDMSAASWYNQTRARETQFTDAYLNNDLVIIKRKLDKLTYSTPAEFKTYIDKRGYRLAVFKDYGYGDYFSEIAPLVSLNFYKYCTQMIRDVANKSTDIALLDHWTAQNSLNNTKNIADHLEVMPTLIQRGLHVTISKLRTDHQAIAEAFNKALAEMKQDGSYQEILKKHHYPTI